MQGGLSMSLDICWFRVEYTSPCINLGKTTSIGYVYTLEEASEENIKDCIYRQIGLPPAEYFPIELKSFTRVDKVYKED